MATSSRRAWRSPRARISAAASTCSVRRSRRLRPSRSRKARRSRRRSSRTSSSRSRLGRERFGICDSGFRIRSRASARILEDFTSPNPNPDSRTAVGLLDRLSPRKTDPDVPAPAVVDDPVFGTKALRKFLTTLTSHETPVLLDLGPVVGSNVSFFGEQLGCKIFVEDIFADLDRHVREAKLDVLPDFLKKRFPQPNATFDGILCWD